MVNNLISQFNSIEKEMDGVSYSIIGKYRGSVASRRCASALRRWASVPSGPTHSRTERVAVSTVATCGQDEQNLRRRLRGLEQFSRAPRESDSPRRTGHERLEFSNNQFFAGRLMLLNQFASAVEICVENREVGMMEFAAAVSERQQLLRDSADKRPESEIVVDFWFVTSSSNLHELILITESLWRNRIGAIHWTEEHLVDSGIAHRRSPNWRLIATQQKSLTRRSDKANGISKMKRLSAGISDWDGTALELHLHVFQEVCAHVPH